MPLSPNDSGSSQSQPINFTSRAADRIAKAVRKVEQGARDQIPFNQQGGLLPQRVFRVATFTAAWPTGSSQVVTFRNITSTPNTVSAHNLFFPITEAPASATNCAVARDGTAWYLVAVPLATTTVSIATITATYVSDINIDATLDTNSCQITVGKTITAGEVVSLNTNSTTKVLILGF